MCLQLSNGADGNPDLHYNRAAVLKYLEEYSQALEGFTRALTIDPTLPAMVCLPTHSAAVHDCLLEVMPHLRVSTFRSVACV